MSHQSQKRKLILILLEFELKFSCAHWGLKSQTMENFLRALPRVLSLIPTKLLPLSGFFLVTPGFGRQEPRILLSKCRILAAAKLPKAFCPHNYQSLPCCLETWKHQSSSSTLLPDLFEEMTRKRSTAFIALQSPFLSLTGDCLLANCIILLSGG